MRSADISTAKRQYLDSGRKAKDRGAKDPASLPCRTDKQRQS
ncbi:hypothetical protein HMPREF0043_00724 [Actinobaculum sp. oral taxon 183 str. F0552]|nr:hypothetical protein HMPREF0043_00724 [Actinobaculum sp. oral taxon 183 str. F0552]